MKLYNKHVHKKHSISFLHAWDGILYAVRTQPNFVIHLAVSTTVIVSGVYLRLSSLEWIILSLVIVLGLAIELLNTAIESTVDIATSKFHPIAKIAKDTAAAAMLVYAVGAVVVGAIIFLPKII